MLEVVILNIVIFKLLLVVLWLLVILVEDISLWFIILLNVIKLLPVQTDILVFHTEHILLNIHGLRTIIHRALRDIHLLFTILFIINISLILLLHGLWDILFFLWLLLFLTIELSRYLVQVLLPLGNHLSHMTIDLLPYLLIVQIVSNKGLVLQCRETIQRLIVQPLQDMFGRCLLVFNDLQYFFVSLHNYKYRPWTNSLISCPREKKATILSGIVK